MSGEYRRLPSGDLTKDVDAYIAAWREYAAPTVKATGGRLYAFDPGIKIVVKGRIIDVDPDLVEAFAAAVPPPSIPDPERAQTWIAMAKSLDPACPEDEAALGIEIAEALTAARTEGEEKERDGWESGMARMALQAPPGTDWQSMNPAKLARVIADAATLAERQRCATAVYDPDDPVNNDPEWKQRSLWLYRAAQAIFDIEEDD